jgi:hypothetical protein
MKKKRGSSAFVLLVVVSLLVAVAVGIKAYRVSQLVPTEHPLSLYGEAGVYAGPV